MLTAWTKVADNDPQLKNRAWKPPTKFNKMLQQLNLFETVNEATNTACFLGAVSVSFDSLIEQLKKYGYSVFIRNSGSKKIIMWSTKTHWASASFIENSHDELKRVCQRLKETIYNVSLPNAP